MPAAFSRVALIGKLNSPEIAASLRALRDIVAAHGGEVVAESATAALIDGGAPARTNDEIGA